MWLADLFMPAREDRFSLLLQQHADILIRVAKELNKYMREGTVSLSDEIDQLEKQADGLLVQLTDALRDTFVTPIDRQDIYNLGEGIDDMIDYLNNAAREIKLFEVSPTKQMCDIAAILQRAAESIDAAVCMLQKNPPEAWERARDAQHAENEVEDIYRAALAELFNGSNVPLIFKLREVYRHLSNSADQAEAVGRLIGKIVVKTT
jgi:uncharacterized protein